MTADNVENIRKRIAAACARVNRNPEEITLVAVAKTFPAERISEAVGAGIADIGENYVQEIREKREVLLDRPIRWHFVGHLQSNKGKYIAPGFHAFTRSIPRASERKFQGNSSGTVAGRQSL